MSIIDVFQRALSFRYIIIQARSLLSTLNTINPVFFCTLFVCHFVPACILHLNLQFKPQFCTFLSATCCFVIFSAWFWSYSCSLRSENTKGVPIFINRSCNLTSAPLSWFFIRWLPCSIWNAHSLPENTQNLMVKIHFPRVMHARDLYSG